MVYTYWDCAGIVALHAHAASFTMVRDNISHAIAITNDTGEGLDEIEILLIGKCLRFRIPHNLINLSR